MNRPLQPGLLRWYVRGFCALYANRLACNLWLRYRKARTREVFRSVPNVRSERLWRWLVWVFARINWWPIVPHPFFGELSIVDAVGSLAEADEALRAPAAPAAPWALYEEDAL